MKKPIYIAIAIVFFVTCFGVNVFSDFYVIPSKKENTAPVLPAKTGQTWAYRTGDDGDLEKGVAWPNPRFTDNGNGTVIDNLTGLVWLKNANCFGTVSWISAIDNCNLLAMGTCGLTDGSSEGDWRLPNLNELESLRAINHEYPSLCNTAGTGKWTEGDPFTGAQTHRYWSSSTNIDETGDAWGVDFNNGSLYVAPKVESHYVWPVRDKK